MIAGLLAILMFIWFISYCKKYNRARTEREQRIEREEKLKYIEKQMREERRMERLRKYVASKEKSK